ncbi:hypothetical protein [Lactobacillus ultunensis]|uniref:Uncharacterized protein n=1 Tax=Lactobacillus ultunensis DSM 16047 TaxID=525365 RepID=C2EK35_9LACO|nr:hypothetical protein HMPREF0548_0031 [Lactobacillus ultunensis DSM 16047]
MILGYEGNKSISISGIVVGLIFCLLLLYTICFSYFQEDGKQFIFKLPYRTKMKVSQPILYAKWRNFQIYKIRSEFQSYSILIISRKKK